MSRCNTIIAAALAAAALAAPTALARVPDIHEPLIKAAAEANKQDLRSPDTRDAARAKPYDLSAARPETAGNRKVSPAAERALAQERYYMSRGKNAATDDDVTTAAERALAQERYYMSQGKNAATDNDVTTAADPAPAQERDSASHGNATPLSNATRTVATDTGDGILRVPFVIAALAALIVGLGVGSGLHVLRARRHAARPVT